MQILIAEDDMTSRAMLQAVLTKWGYDVTATSDGEKLAEYNLPAKPVYDGLIAANGKLYISLTNGNLVCFEE